jgi:glutamate-1-semialdehyde 2,1-aminomutase
VELVRFANSGSEAVATALRVARAQSGRDGFVMVEGAFHGMFDPVLWRTQMESWNPSGVAPPVVAPFGRGIPTAHRDLVGVVPFNDVEALAQLLQQEASRIGAMILEPILGNCCAIAAQVEYLQEVRRLCDEYGVVLIFDEVKTGFRIGTGGAQEYYGVTPDLSTFARRWPTAIRSRPSAARRRS